MINLSILFIHTLLDLIHPFAYFRQYSATYGDLKCGDFGRYFIVYDVYGIITRKTTSFRSKISYQPLFSDC